MQSEVYLLRITDWKDSETVADRFASFLRETGLLEGAHPGHLAGVKLTFGEAGNTGYPPPPLVREIVSCLRERGARPFLTETNTLYAGRRKNSVDHLALAREHGFGEEAIGAPILLGDGLLGRDEWLAPIPNGHHAQDRLNGRQAQAPLNGREARAHLSPAVRDMDFLVGLAHATGHLLTGYGGAIKNLGMGLASRAGKLEMHSSIAPVVREDRCTLCGRCAADCAAGAITLGARAAVIDAGVCTGCAECLAVCPTSAIGIDWNSSPERVQELMADYAAAAIAALSGRAAFINLLHQVTRHCDCLGEAPETIAPEVGIVASLDPVALDQASLDLLREATGRDPFREAWPEADPEVQLRQAERIGLGRREYRVLESGLPRNRNGR